MVVRYLTNADGLGIAESDGKVGFYGTTPIAQRGSTAQLTSKLSVSTDFGASQAAALVEVMNTLVALGIWKGSA